MQSRILYVALDIVPAPKGAATHITQFVRGLTSAGYAVDLVTVSENQKNDDTTVAVEPIKEYEGARHFCIALDPEANFLERAAAFDQAVARHVAAHPPYAVHHYRSVWGGMAAALERKSSTRTLFEVNGLPSIELKYHYPGIDGTALMDKIREQELALLAHSDSVITVSEVTRQFLISLGVPRSKITVIPNGVTTHDFARPAMTQSPDGNTNPVLLYVGTLAEWQGLETLLQALPILREKHSVRLHLLGPGRSRHRKALRKLARKLGVEDFVELLEPVPHHQVPQILQSAAVCIAPLALNDRNVVQGCCPLKVLEYMAAGRPIVAANLPVVRELVREDIDGLLFFPGDPTDLARQVGALLDDPERAKRLGQRAAQRVQDRFTWHVAVKKLLKVYDQLLAA